MTEEQFADRVASLTALSEHQPARYRRGVLLWTLIGYAALGGLLFGGLALIAGMLGVAALLAFTMKILALKLLFKGGFLLLLLPLLALVRVVLGALRVRVPAPEGVEVTEAEVPRLFALIDEVRKPLGVARPRHVLLVDDLNASVAEVPRLGVLPWFTTYLLVGVPMMQALSEDELRCVLAHEFGHLSAADGRLGSWVYRVQSSWFRVAESVEQQHVGGADIIARFFDWYLPRFSAWTFVLRRSQEYSADAASVRATDARTAADALLRVQLAAKAMEANVERLQEHMKEQDSPPADFYEVLGQRFREPSALHQAWLDEALAVETGIADSHPCVRDRVAALGEQTRLPPAITETAAEAIFGDQLPSLLAERSTAWRERVHSAWYDHHHELRRQAERHAELDAKPERSREEWLEWARLSGDVQGAEAAVIAWSRVVDRFPDNSVAIFHLGISKLAYDLDDGLAHLRRACELDDEAVIPAARVAAAYLTERGRGDEVSEWQTRFDARIGGLEAEHRERRQFDVDTALAPHGLGPAHLEHVKELLRNSEGIVTAWLHRKQVPGAPVYVLALESTPVGEWDADEAAAYAAAGFEVPGLEGDFQIFALHQLDKPLRDRLVADPDAELVF